MAKTPKKISELYVKEINKDFLKAEYVDVPNTQIQNRAQMVDLSQDLGVRFGINRIQTQKIFEIKDEAGPNGELVYGVVNDKFNQIRFVGSGWGDSNNVNGTFASTATLDDFVEVTFYGTGINLGTIVNGAVRDYRVTVDGGAESGSIYPTSPSSVLANRNYSSNQIVPMASGLSLGWHTVKLRLVANGLEAYNFEILNESTDLTIQKGTYFNDGKILRSLTDVTTAYDSDFTNILGVAGAKGGAVSVYLTEGGEVKKDVQYTDVTAKFLTNTDHTNEEVVTKHNFREFTAGRADDFHSLTPSIGTKAFTLDDGTTTLTCNSCRVTNIAGKEGVNPDSTSNNWTLTFVGTGLDLIMNVDTSNKVTAEPIYVDGVLIGTMDQTSFNDETIKVKICSGLPYGTHTVKLLSASSLDSHTSDFIIYGPKKPAIADSSKEIGSYNLMADFVPLSTTALDATPTGVLSKQNTREFTYKDGTGGTVSFAMTIVGGGIYSSGFQTLTNRLNGYVEYTFFGTGFTWLYQTSVVAALGVTFTLNGQAITAANFPTMSDSIVGSGTFDNNTGVLVTRTAGPTLNGSSLNITDLPLGTYTIRATNGPIDGNAQMHVMGLDIITPIHSPKLNGPFVLQNTPRVGSQGVSDSRKLESDKDKKQIVVSEGVVAGPTTASTGFIPIVDSHCTIQIEKDGNFELQANITSENNTNVTYFAMYIDGKEVGKQANTSTNAGRKGITVSHIAHLSAGTHTFQMFYRVSAGTVALTGTVRNFQVKEI